MNTEESSKKYLKNPTWRNLGRCLTSAMNSQRGASNSCGRLENTLQKRRVALNQSKEGLTKRRDEYYGAGRTAGLFSIRRPRAGGCSTVPNG